MYEVHGWFGLTDSTYESDRDALELAVGEIRDAVDRQTWPNIVALVRVLNGQYFLLVAGFVNRRREEGAWIDNLLELVRLHLPGSWGMLYERDDEMLIPPGENAFRVTVMARGKIMTRLDPFLSPCNPVIED